MAKNDILPKIALIATAGTILALATRTISRHRSRLGFKGQSVIISGGSRGLGLVIARLLAQEGARLALLARDDDELDRAREDLISNFDAEVMTLSCDISKRADVDNAVARVIRRYGVVDVLINNAGIIQVGPFDHMVVEDFENAMAVHFWGPLYAIWAVMPQMKKQAAGRIANISSIGGKVAIPHLAPYVASKFALSGLSDALRAELAKDNISVTTIIPGLMRTGSHVNAFFKGHNRLEFTWFSVINALPVTSTTAEHAARKIIEAIRHGDAECVITPQARVLILANAFFPGLFAWINKLVNRLMPRPVPHGGNESRSGWESHSRLSPSAITSLADQGIFQNNEMM